MFAEDTLEELYVSAWTDGRMDGWIEGCMDYGWKVGWMSLFTLNHE